MRKGFTLLELIVVVAIIAMLATVGVSSYQNVQVNSRNAKRKADLKEIKKSLAAYYGANARYPCSGTGATACTTPAWRGTCSGYGSYSDTGATGYVPGLAPQYIDKLPRDPRESQTNPGSATAICRTTAGNNCYVYYSNGVDYKMLVNCSPEGTMSATDPFYDSARPTQAWAVWSSSTSSGW